MTAWRDSRDGPLPPMMLALTLVTGLVDATSYLRIGHVFVANMTGNVVFLGFAIAGAKGLSAVSSLVAIAAFILGGVIGGRLGVAVAHHRGLILRAGLTAQFAFLAAAAVVAGASGAGVHVGSATRYALIVLLGVGMGIQNATVRRVGVHDLTTTVLTMTLTGLAADARVSGGPGAAMVRRVASIATMVLGALVGALLALRVDDFAPLAVAAGVVALTALAAHLVSGREEAWTKP